MAATICLWAGLTAGFTLPPRPPTASASSFTHHQQSCLLDRRAALLNGATALGALLAVPPPAAHAAELSTSRMLSVREYVVELKAARRSCEDLRPLLEEKSTGGYEAARVLLRKQPLFGIRKACYKVLQVLDGDAERLKVKTKAYDEVKAALDAVDIGCKRGFDDSSKKPDLLPELARLEASLDGFVAGLSPPPIVPPPPPPPPPAEPEPVATAAAAAPDAS